jgi:hypothetical protein
MADEHQPAVPAAIEEVVSRIAELEVVLGDAARAVIPSVRARLTEAMAARDRGNLPDAIERIGQAMDTLAALADRLDPAEALLMRALSQRFRGALLQGDQAAAKQAAAVMFDKSGAREREQK